MNTILRLIIAVLLPLGSVAYAEGPPPPPPNAPQGDDQVTKAEWYVSPSGTSMGPKTIAELIELAKTRTITRDTPVWKDGWPAWKLLSDVAELSAVVAAMPTAPTPPPAPPNVQGALEEKMKEFLVGDWKFEGNINQGAMSAYAKIEILFRTDGSYAGSQSVQYAMPGSIQPPASVFARQGRWSVVGIDDNNFVLRLNEQGGAPTEAKMHIIDKNSFQNADNLNTWYRMPQ